MEGKGRAGEAGRWQVRGPSGNSERFAWAQKEDGPPRHGTKPPAGQRPRMPRAHCLPTAVLAVDLSYSSGRAGVDEVGLPRRSPASDDDLFPESSGTSWRGAFHDKCSRGAQGLGTQLTPCQQGHVVHQRRARCRGEVGGGLAGDLQPYSDKRPFEI